MKNKFKVSLLVFLIVILGCFTSVFADTTNDGAEIGTANLNNTTENSAKIGNILTHPEIGWKRYDDTNSNIVYGSQNTLSNTSSFSNAYQGTIHQPPGEKADNSQVTFKFIGTKIRIIMGLNRSGISSVSSRDVSVKLDGQEVGSINGTNDSDVYVWQQLSFEKTNLTYGPHVIVLNSEDKLNYMFDAIDIDSTGYLINVLNNIATGITLNKTTDGLTVGQSDNLTATVTPDDVTNKTVTWTSSDTSVATVDSNGKVTAIKKGTANITATTQDGSNLSSSCTINVTEPTTISLDKMNDSINVGQTDNITATVNPSNVGVTWSSSDNSIVIVDSLGKITGLKEGQAIITANTADGKTATCTVNVIAQQVTKVKLTLYMNDSTTRKFDLTQDEFNDFMNWYTNMSEEVKGTIPYYIFSIPAQGTIPAQKHCVPFAKIESFEFE